MTNLRTSKSKHLLYACALGLCSMAFLQCQKGNDYFLVIDTSGSMASQENLADKQNKDEPANSTLEQIQSEVGQFVNQLDKNDTITLLSFDDKTIVSNTVTIKEESDKTRVVQQVQQLEAKGRYTDMGQMILSLQKLKKSKAQEGRQQFFVVMSDGKDDPPPDSRREKLDLAKLRAPLSKKDPIQLMNRSYIYYVSLGKEYDPALSKKLATLSDQPVKILQKKDTNSGNQQEAGQTGSEKNQAETEIVQLDPDQDNLAVVKDDIEEQKLAANMRYWGIWIAAVVCAILLILLLIWLWNLFRNRHKPQGTLRYYEEVMGPNMKDSVELDKLEKSRFSLGSKSGVDVKIRELGIKSLGLKAARKNNQNVLLLKDKSKWGLFDFEKQSKSGQITPGDNFKLGNCIIEYLNDTDK